MSYIPGGTYGICDRCGFQFRRSELRKEWTGLMVCRKDWDPRPPQLRAPVVGAEGAPKPTSRPDNQTDDTPNTTTPEDL